MPQSPIHSETDLVTYDLQLNGTELPGRYMLVSAEVVRDLNRIPEARIVFVDGNPAEEKFELSETDHFAPGAEITLNVGYHASNHQCLFKGLVVGHRVRMKESGTSELEVTCYDKALKMTVGRKNALFLNKKDSDIISQLISGYSLTTDVTATTTQHAELIQYNSTDWDFMLTRAELNGLQVNVIDGSVAVVKPVVSGNAALVVTYGTDIRSFDLELTAMSQLRGVKGKAWDTKTQAVAESAGTEPTVNNQGNITGSNLANVLAPAQVDLIVPTPLDKGVLKAWADAQLMRARLSRIQGRVVFQGSALAKPNTIISIAGISTRLNGDAYVTGVTHTIADGAWRTEARVGLSAAPFVESRPHVQAPPAAGQLPGISGLYTAQVKKIHEDPDGAFRIQVNIPLLGQEGVWARLSHVYASNQVGTYFIPEVGDEVLLGFLGDDPSYPVVLGSLYSSKNKAPFTPDDKNTYKGLVSRSKMKLSFDDEKKIVLIETPGGNSVTISDDAKQIELKDQHGNTITMAQAGITLKSAKDIVLDATGKIEVKATGEISLKSQGGDLKGEGLNVSLKGQIGMTAEGTATSELKSAGQTTVKGAIVMIN
ncbi:MAG: type VI secretion system tip protein VgrG [Bacteroidia bacterium]|nr:type VI secretion system tip protein VgrG [Bacteroidia bacterium]